MIFGNCNLKIFNLYPRIDRNDLGDYYFSVGIEKSFAKKCFEAPLTKTGYNNLQNMGRMMFEKVFGNDEYMPLFDNHYPYCFFENSEGKTTSLISNLTVPMGNACGLDFDMGNNIEKELDLENMTNYNRFIELIPHNIDTPTQCYAFLSLISTWEGIMDAQFWEVD